MYSAVGSARVRDVRARVISGCPGHSATYWMDEKRGTWESSLGQPRTWRAGQIPLGKVKLSLEVPREKYGCR